jgi:hypothetical protein
MEGAMRSSEPEGSADALTSTTPYRGNLGKKVTVDFGL